MLSSRERILRTIAGDPADHVPMCFVLFSGLRSRCEGELDFCRRLLDLGVDVCVDLGGLPLGRRPEVQVRTTLLEGRPNPFLRQVWHTPAGELETVVEKTPDWPHGDRVPIQSDFVIPRAKKPLVAEEKDLGPLRYLLPDPTEDEIAAFLGGAEPLLAFAREHGLATRAGFNRLSDMLCWLCGCEWFATAHRTSPAVYQGVLDIVDAWQRKLLDATLQARPDIVVDAQWYATTFLSPSLYRRFILPPLRRRAEIVHEAGAKFCAIATTNVLPFADCLKEIGIDCLFGVDPIMGGWDLARAKRELGGAMCLAGGVNGYLTIVDGSADKVRAAVRKAIEALAPGGRFILAPVDDVRTEPESPPGTWERAWRNVQVMVEEWKRLR